MEAIEIYLNEAFDEAFQSVRNNIGGPFGAVVVLNGTVIGKGGNQVSSQNDPTAHAEIVAIRDACKKTGSFDLAGANIHSVYYCSTRHEAESIGFKDNHIYQELNRNPDQRSITFRHIDHSKAVELFREWNEKIDKTLY